MPAESTPNRTRSVAPSEGPRAWLVPSGPCRADDDEGLCVPVEVPRAVEDPFEDRHAVAAPMDLRREPYCQPPGGVRGERVSDVAPTCRGASPRLDLLRTRLARCTHEDVTRLPLALLTSGTPTRAGDRPRRRTTCRGAVCARGPGRGRWVGRGRPGPSDGDDTLRARVQVEPASARCGRGSRRWAPPHPALGTSRYHDAAAAVVGPSGSRRREPGPRRVDDESLGLELGTWRAQLHRWLEHPVAPGTRNSQMWTVVAAYVYCSRRLPRGRPGEHVTVAYVIDVGLGPRPVSQPSPYPYSGIRTSVHGPGDRRLARDLGRESRVGQAELERDSATGRTIQGFGQ